MGIVVFDGEVRDSVVYSLIAVASWGTRQVSMASAFLSHLGNADSLLGSMEK